MHDMQRMTELEILRLHPGTGEKQKYCEELTALLSEKIRDELQQGPAAADDVPPGSD